MGRLFHPSWGLAGGLALPLGFAATREASGGTRQDCTPIAPQLHPIAPQLHLLQVAGNVWGAWVPLGKPFQTSWGLAVCLAPPLGFAAAREAAGDCTPIAPQLHPIAPQLHPIAPSPGRRQRVGGMGATWEGCFNRRGAWLCVSRSPSASRRPGRHRGAPGRIAPRLHPNCTPLHPNCTLSRSQATCGGAWVPLGEPFQSSWGSLVFLLDCTLAPWLISWASPRLLLGLFPGLLLGFSLAYLLGFS